MFKETTIQYIIFKKVQDIALFMMVPLFLYQRGGKVLGEERGGNTDETSVEYNFIFILNQKKNTQKRRHSGH
jgi:hypothetical protein